MIPLFAGILIAALLFSALLTCAYLAAVTQGRRRWMNIATIALTIAAMAAISNALVVVSQAVGVALLVASTTVVIMTPGWNRLLPMALVAFAIVLIARLPFA